MANDTKERILATAQDMFSKNGYAGTNIRELTVAFGMVKSSIYKHFEDKKAIWNTLLDRMIAYYDERFGSTEHLPPVPDSLEALVTMTLKEAVSEEDRRVLELGELPDGCDFDCAFAALFAWCQAAFTRIESAGKAAEGKNGNQTDSLL